MIYYIKLYRSEAAMRKHFVETGDELASDETLKVPLENVSRETREIIWKYGFPSQAAVFSTGGVKNKIELDRWPEKPDDWDRFFQMYKELQEKLRKELQAEIGR